MKKKISFSLWLKVVATGIWQGLCLMTHPFNSKYTKKFWRIVACVITGCVAFLTLVFGWLAYEQFFGRFNRCWFSSHLSSEVDFYECYYNPHIGYLQSVRTGKRLLENVDWVSVPVGGDSLAVFAKDGKRGYVNRFTGEVVIPNKYLAAWVFSSDAAAVVEKDSVFFIDHSGRPINDKKFYRSRYTDGYCFHGEYCAVAVSPRRFGLVNKAGEWVAEPVYKSIDSAGNGMWRLLDANGNVGMMNDSAQMVVPCEYEYVCVIPNDGLLLTRKDRSQSLLEFDGTVRKAFVCRYMEPLYYTSEERDSANEFIQLPATCMHYTMSSGYEGLADMNGHPITKPDFWTVQAVGRDLYLCSYKDAGAGILLNGKGEVVAE